MLKSPAFLTYLLLLLLTRLCLRPGPAYGQPAGVRQSRHSLPVSPSDSTRALVYIELGRNFMQLNLDSSWHYLHKAIGLAQKLSDKRMLTKAYNALATTYVVTGESTKGLAILRQAEQLSRPYPFDSTRLEVQARMTQAYRIQGNYQQALRLGLALANYLDKHPDQQKGPVVTLYTELALVYQQFKTDSLALAYYVKAYTFAENSHSKKSVLVAAGNLGEYYVTHHQVGKAEFYLQKSLAISRELHLDHSIAETLRNLGQIKQQQHHYQAAIAYYNQALSIQKKIGAKEFIGYIYLQQAQSYLGLHALTKAFVCVEQAIRLFRTIQSDHYLYEALVTKATLQKQQGAFEGAVESIQQAQTLKDSLTGLEKQKAIAQIQARYDLERKQNQIANLKRNLIVQQQAKKTIQLQLTLAQHQRTFYAIVSILLLLLAIIVYLNFNKLKKAQRLLSQQTNEIQVQTDRLIELNKTKDQLFSIISHDLRSPLVRLRQDIRQLQTDMDRDAEKKDTRSLLAGIEHRTDSLLALLITLLDWAYLQFKGFQINLQVINLTDQVAQAVSYFSERVHQKQITVINQVNDDQPVVADAQQLAIVLRNLIDNAVKFTPAGGYIRLLTVPHANTIELQIRDTGIGMTSEMNDKLFTQPEVRQGTQEEPGTGLGIQICRALVLKQKGQLIIESQPNKGTTVKIILAKASVSS